MSERLLECRFSEKRFVGEVVGGLGRLDFRPKSPLRYLKLFSWAALLTWDPVTVFDSVFETKVFEVVVVVVEVKVIESMLVLRVRNGDGGKLLNDVFSRFFLFDKCFRMASAAWRNLALLPVSKPLFRFRFWWFTKIGSSSENENKFGLSNLVFSDCWVSRLVNKLFIFRGFHFSHFTLQ